MNDLQTRRALVFTAFRKEYDAVRKHLDEITEVEHPEGDIYERGIFKHNAVIWETGIVEVGKGNPNAAQKTERAITHFNPEVVMFVGVAGGIKDVAIGDVVVATKVYGCHFGKAADDFQSRPEIGLPGYRMFERAKADARKADWHKRISTSLQGTTPKVFTEPIAATEQVITSKLSDSYKLIKSNYSDAVACETEGYGFLKAVSTRTGLESLVVRGVSDLLEGKEAADQRGSQEMAAGHAAAFAFEVLANVNLPEKLVKVETVTKEVVRTVTDATNVYSSIPNQAYFFGRKKELEIIAGAISPESRMWGALIVGPGGIGKTALAIRAAYDAPAEQFPLKIFLSAKVRQMTSKGEEKLEDFMLRNYQELLKELGKEIGVDQLERISPKERAKEVRRALSKKCALIIIDNLETLPSIERDRLFQFLSNLPPSCKAIVTSRRRPDRDAQVVSLDRMLQEEALEYIAELAKNNLLLNKEPMSERIALYRVTQGNPLLIRWLVGQLGREGSHCQTILGACNYLNNAPKGNDPLEFIFGDLLDTFTEFETKVLAALTHFPRLAKVEWITEMTGLEQQEAQTALKGLTYRSLLVSDNEERNFFLPVLAAHFIKSKRPEVVAQTGNMLCKKVYELAMENGDKFELFPILQNEWEMISMALQLLTVQERDHFCSVCESLEDFLDFVGRWDEVIILNTQAEEIAIEALDYLNAGWCAMRIGWAYNSLQNPDQVFKYAERCSDYWEKANAEAWEKACALRLKGVGHELNKNYTPAKEAYREALELLLSQDPSEDDVAFILSDIASIELIEGNYEAAEKDWREALRLAKDSEHQEEIAIYSGNLVEIELCRENWLKAELLARDALELAEKVGRLELIGGDQWYIAKALARQGKGMEGLPYAQRAVEILTKLKLPVELKSAEAALRECEEGGEVKNEK